MSTLLGVPTAKTAAATTPSETTLKVQSSVAGKVVAVVLGTRRVAGNLIWYGDFAATAHQSGGSSSGGGGGKGGGDAGDGGSSTSYTYTASTMVGLCVGTIHGVGKVWVADDEVALAGLGAAVTVKMGAPGQSAWPWLVTKRVGVVQGNARTGHLTAALASGADPDAANTLAVDVSESRASLLSGTRADADLLNTRCWVDGEIVAYETATLTGPNAYDLTYLRRGAFGTAVATHALGGRFARLDGSIFTYPFTVDMIGATIHIKALGFNPRGGGLQSLADVAAYAYTITGSEPPPTPINFFRRNDIGYWEIPTPPGDLAGTRVRHMAGRTRNWSQGKDWPTDGAVVTAREIDLAQFGGGERTLMIRSVDTAGNLSTGTAYLTVGLGELPVANIVSTYDVRGAGFPGTLTGGAVVGGNLAANDDGGLYLADDTVLYLPHPQVLYLPVAYRRMEFGFIYVPPRDCVPGALSMDAAISGDGWQILCRMRNGALYLEYDDVAYLTDDQGPYLDDAAAWLPWPGKMDSVRAPFEFHVVVEAGSRRGTVSALTMILDVPDVMESFNDLVISIGGTRVPISQTYRAIDYVGEITIQDDGGGAVNVLVVDKNPVTGPLLRAVDGGGNAVTATIDIRNLKGH